MDKINAGYKITDNISVEGNHFALGHNPKAPEPYAVWFTNEDMTHFQWGRYFTEKGPAIADMILRATYQLERPDGIPLSVDFLAENAREALYLHAIDINAAEDIQNTLEEILQDEEFDSPLSAEDIMKNLDFMSLATHRYHNLDHSNEYYALKETLEDIFRNEPRYLNPEYDISEPEQAPTPKAMHAEVKIPPELADLVKDILSMPTAAVVEKYGPLGDNITFEFDLEEGKKATLEIVPSYEPTDEHKHSATVPHHILLTGLDAEGKKCFTTQFSEDALFDKEQNRLLPFRHLDPEFGPMILEVSEDESLRRVGNSFVFNSSTQDTPYAWYDGDVCTVQRALSTKEEYDILSTGLMWEVKFQNGKTLHVFDRELEGPIPEVSRKNPLSQQISSAQEKTSQEPISTEPKEKDR